MRKCSNCGAQIDDVTKFCPKCGTMVEESSFINPVENGSFSSAVENPVEQTKIHVVRGILGTLLCSLAGVVVYVVLYMLGYVAWISAFVMYAAAAFGFRKFSGTGTATITSVIIAAIITIIMIPAAECICLTGEIYAAFGPDGYSILDCALSVPAMLEEPDIFSSVAEDIGFMYIVGAVVCVIELVSKVFRRK